MTEEEIVGLGQWGEELLESDFFALVVRQFEEQAFQHMMLTEPKASKEREYIYTKIGALRDFLGHIRAYVEAKDAIEKREAPSPDEDALVEGIDY